MNERPNLTGAILAGGRSTRMGRPKETLTLPDGRLMIEAVADVLSRVTRRVVVVGGTEALPDVEHVDDLRTGTGPLAGIEALLASGLDEEYLVTPCDLPRLTAELLMVVARPSVAPMTVLHIGREGIPRPLPARISARTLGAVRACLDSSRRAVRDLVEDLDAEDGAGVDIVHGPAVWGERLANVNTEREWEEMVGA